MTQLMRYWGRKPLEIIDEVMRIISGTVIDPFGGAGTTILSALRHGNKGVYLDINPYAWLVAFVNIIKIDAEEFRKRGEEVQKNLVEVKEESLKDDYLYYPDGKPFLKKENVDRVSQLFSPNNFKKLYSILRTIDDVETTPEIKIALYGAFCSSLFKASKMKRENAGSWGVPSYWIPEKHKEVDAVETFSSEVKRFYSYFKRNMGYKLHEDVELFIKDALSFRYDEDLVLFTDPPFFDEIQYMELSFFYWAWLKESKFREVVRGILGEEVDFRINDEIIVNPNRNMGYNNYLSLMKKFLNITSKMRKKYLIFHYDKEALRNRFVDLVKEEWGNIKIKDFIVGNHRKIGARGSSKYILIQSE